MPVFVYLVQDLYDGVEAKKGVNLDGKGGGLSKKGLLQVNKIKR